MAPCDAPPPPPLMCDPPPLLTCDPPPLLTCDPPPPLLTWDPPPPPPPLPARQVRLPTLKTPTTINVTEPILAILRTLDILIESSFLSQPVELHSIFATLASILLNVRDFSVRERHLHILVLVDQLHAHSGLRHRLPKIGDHVFDRLAQSDSRRRHGIHRRRRRSNLL